MISYHLVKALSWIVCHLPAGVCEVLGRILGALCWPLVPKRRKVMARDNIRRCLGVSEEEANRIAKASSVRFGPMLFEVLRFPIIKDHIDDYVKLEGAVDAMREAVKAGKGAIISASHTGNWELMGGAFAQNGFPLVGVAMKQKASGMDRFINEYRTMIGMHITYKTGVREMYKMLSDGWIIGLIMDQDTSRRNGIILDFFNQPTNCVTGAASMARFDQVPIFPAFMHRQPDGTHILHIDPPVIVERTKDKREDIRRTTQILTKRIEDDVRAYPEDWFWLHDRWKSMREE